MLGNALGRTQLHRKLKAILTRSPGELIRVVRLQRALEPLKASAGTISEVVYRVGFGLPSSFSQHFGYAPSEVKNHP